MKNDHPKQRPPGYESLTKRADLRAATAAEAKIEHVTAFTLWRRSTGDLPVADLFLKHERRADSKPKTERDNV